MVSLLKSTTERLCIKRLALKTICFSKSELMHDPLIGKTCQVSRTSHSFLLFKKLQKALHMAYETYAIIARLNFHITQFANQEHCHLYNVRLDFSTHQFDSIDKQQLQRNSFGEDFNFVQISSSLWAISIIKNSTVNFLVRSCINAQKSLSLKLVLCFATW